MSPSRILIIRFSSLGDITLVSPVTRALRLAFPDAEIVLATKAVYEVIGRMLPGVNGVISLGTQGLGALISRIRDRRFDLIIDLHANLRSRWLCALGGSERVLRYRKRRLARMAMTRRPSWPIPARHTVELYTGPLRALGLTVTDFRPELLVSDQARDAVAEKLLTEGVEPADRLLGLAPGASSPVKRWPSRYFAALADRIAAEPVIPVIIGDQKDRDSSDHLVSLTRSRVINWTGAIDLDLLPALIQRCQALISNDSGPMHIASAVGAPVVGIFGPTHPKLGFAPLGQRDVALTLDLACSPCSLHGQTPCRLKTHACMESLSVERVLQAVMPLMR